MTGLVIVDDHAFVAESLAQALEERALGPVIVLEPTEERLLGRIAEIRPRMCLIDLDLGKHRAHGVTLIEPITAEGIPVVVFTGSDDEATLGECLERGAVSILRKGGGLKEIAGAVEQALAGEDLNSEAQKYHWLMAATTTRREEVSRLLPFRDLTNREAEVLAALSAGMSAEEIASEGYVALATVRSQIRAVLRKLGVHSQLSAVVLCHRAGWSPPHRKAG
jgi:DNA-binding NarL/FixJ family response regulator